MLFEWDATKSERNARERGLPFELASRLFDRPTVELVDPRPWSEKRVKAIGVIDGREYVVVYTERAEVRRLISFRDAHRKERDFFWRMMAEVESDG